MHSKHSSGDDEVLLLFDIMNNFNIPGAIVRDCIEKMRQ